MDNRDKMEVAEVVEGIRIMERELPAQVKYFHASQAIVKALCTWTIEEWEKVNSKDTPSEEEILAAQKRIITDPLAEFGIILTEDHHDRLWGEILQSGYTGLGSCEVWDIAHGLQHAVEKQSGRGETRH